MNMRGASQSRAALARDAALARISRARRWIIFAAAGLTAGFAALVSAVAPGRSLASKSSSRTEAATASASVHAGTGGSSSIPSMPPPAKAGDLGLQGPNQAPSSSPDPSQSQSDPSQQSAPSQSQSDPSQSQSDPSQAAPTPAPAPPGPVVSGGS